MMEWVYKLLPFLRPKPARMYTVTKVEPFKNTKGHRGAYVTLVADDEPGERYVNVCFEMHFTGGLKPLPEVGAHAYQYRLEYTSIPFLWFIERDGKWWNHPMLVPNDY